MHVHFFRFNFIWPALIFILLSSASERAWAQVKISAKVDQSQVAVNEPFTYTVTIEFGGEQSNAQPVAPDFGGLRVRGGPNQSQQLYSINGAVRFILAYSWILEAPREGRYVIAPAQL